MPKSMFLLSAAMALAISVPAEADTYIPVPPVPGSTAMTVFDINDNNVIVGSFRDPASGKEHGFFGTLDGNYKTFDFPGSSNGTEPRAIANDGGINGIAFVGGFAVGEEFYRTPSGKIKIYTLDSAPMDGIAQGFNSADLSMGDYGVPGNPGPFGYFGMKGKYKRDFVLHVKGQTFPCCKSKDSSRDVGDPVPGKAGRGIGGSVTGFFTDAGGMQHGFIQTGKHAQVIDFPGPKTALTALQGINNAGVVAGQWVDIDGLSHAFVLDNGTGVFTTLNPNDGSASQQAWGINNAGLTALSTSSGNSFIYCPLPAGECPAPGRDDTVHRLRVDPRTFLRYDPDGRTARKLPPAASIPRQGPPQ
jgi:hypothetical protein